MKRTNNGTMRFIALTLVAILGLWLVMLPPSALAAPPAQGPTPTPPPSGDGNPITQIINQIIQFPFENLVEALQNAAKSILSGTVTPLESFFSASIARWLTSSPGIITPGGGIAQGDDVMGPAWRLMIKVAVLLWPLTLAIIAAIAAKDAVAAASWGIGDLKEALGGWLIAVVASATSLYWMDLANRFTNATTTAILNMSFTGEAGFQPNALTTLVFGTATIVLTIVAMPATLIIVVFVILMGLAVLSALIFQFLARFVILYILVALAPVVIILGVLPPLGWFRYMWLRGFVLVEAIGPINALLLKLVMVLAVRGPSNDPITAFVDFIGAIGVLSILITIDGIIIKGVFGAAAEVMEKAVSTVTALATLALAGVTALAGGAIAGSAVGAGAATTTGGATSAGSAGASSASAAGAAGASGPASVARSAFSPSASLRAGSGAALRGAGDVMFRQPGMLGSFGAAMRSLGGTLERREHDGQSQAQRGGSHGGQGSAPGGNAPGGGTRPRNPTSPSPTASSASSSNQSPSQSVGTSSNVPSAPSSNPSAAPSNSVPGTTNVPNASSSAPSPRQTTAAPPNTPTASGAVPLSNNVTGVSDAAIPPPQTPSVSPMGAPLAIPSMPTNVGAPKLSREAADAANILPTPLGERAGTFASLYSDPRDQAAAARATVDAFNQVNAQGQGFYDIGWQGSAWDRSMAPVIASARQGLPLETMAQDAGYGGNVAGFLANRMLENREPALQVPSHQIPWHPQMAPHDWEIGAAVSNGLGNQITQGAAARVYHEIRSPETGGGWSAGAQFIQTVQEILHGAPTDPIAALETRLNEMQARGVVPQRAMTLWRANSKRK